MKWLKYMWLFLAVVLVGCQERVRPVEKPAYFKEADLALAHLAKSVSQQIDGLKFPDTPVPIDEFFNESSAEVATSGKIFQTQLASLLSKEHTKLAFASLNRKNIESAQWIVLSSYAPVKEKNAEQPGTWVRLKVTVADIVTGQQLASSESFLQASQFQSDPTRFFKEAPMYLNDQRHRERIDVINGKAQPLKQKLTIQAIFAEAVTAYDDGKYDEAETAFADVLKLVPDHRGALTGKYQILWHQGKKAEAVTAFTNLLSLSADSGNVSIRILFKLNGTDFVDVGDLAQQYRLWTKSMGQVISAKSRCLDVVGHASRSGSAEYNDRLSFQRANRIAGMIQQQTPATQGKVKAFGKGYQETIVGNGANDASDAIDRRVEFVVKTCS